MASEASSSVSSHSSGSSSGSSSSETSWKQATGVDKFIVKHTSAGSPYVEVRNNDGERKLIRDLSELPSYKHWLQNATAPSGTHSSFFKDFDSIYHQLEKSKIAINRGLDCANRLLNICHPQASLRATDGFLYYNRKRDVNTFGVASSPTGVSIRAIQAHIESMKADKDGRVSNELKLRKDTLYLLRGLEQYVHPTEVQYHQDVTTFRAPRAYVDHALMCDMYNYPEVNHLSVTRETRNGRVLIMQANRAMSVLCANCRSQTNRLYYENCDDEDCSISSIFEVQGQTCRIVSNDILFSQFDTVIVRAIKLQRFEYGPILEATKLIARLHKNIPRDHVKEICSVSRCCPLIFLKVAVVSRRLRGYFSDHSTCYMLAPGERGQLVQTKPLRVDLDVRLLSTEINAQYVDRVNFEHFALTETEPGAYHLSRSDVAYMGPRNLGEIKLGAMES